MEYQDRKLRAIARLALIASVMSVLLAAALIYPERTGRIVRHLPLWRRSGNEGIVCLGTLATFVLICWGVLLSLIFTSPEQEVRFVRWTKRWRSSPLPFEAIEFDTGDPDYRKAAWRYFVDRCRR
jgi:hypothetical protein